VIEKKEESDLPSNDKQRS